MQRAEFLPDVERVDGRWQFVVQLEQMKAVLVPCSMRIGKRLIECGWVKKRN
jgi:hypothetical protein